jgi:Flp pilus assembly protein TadD
MMGRIGEAVDELDAAHRAAPFEEMVLFDLARVRLKQNRNDEARALLTRALELRPGSQAVSQLLSDIQRE